MTVTDGSIVTLTEMNRRQVDRNSIYSEGSRDNEEEADEPWLLTNARIIHIALFCVVLLYQIATTTLFLRYRAKFTKNKFDSHLILLVALLGALNLYFCSAESIFGDENLPCWLRHYVSFVQIPTFYFLIIVRAWRIVFVSKIQTTLLARRNPSPVSSFASYGNAGQSSDPTLTSTDTVIDLFHSPVPPLFQKSDSESVPPSKRDRNSDTDDLENPSNSDFAKQKKLVSELRMIGWVTAFFIVAFAVFAVVHFYFYPQWLTAQSPNEADEYCEKVEDYPVYISNIVFLLVVPFCINALRHVDDNLWLGTSLMITFAFSIPLMIMFHLSGALPILLDLSRQGFLSDSFWLLPWYIVCHTAFVGIPVFLEFRERSRRNSQKNYPEMNHEDFEDMLSKPSRFREFKQYMTKELCIENALFYEQFTSLLSYMIKRRGNKFKEYLAFEGVSPGEDQDACENMGTVPACYRQFLLASRVPMDPRIESRLDAIYDTFIASNAASQLNISHAVQAILSKERKEGTNSLLSWKPVLKEVYYMMYSNTYFRYVNGSDWKKRLSQTNLRV